MWAASPFNIAKPPACSRIHPIQSCPGSFFMLDGTQGRPTPAGGIMRKVLHWVLFAGVSVLLAGCGGSATPSLTLTGIAVQPKSILAWPDHVFTAVGVYSDGSTGALNAQVSWSDDVYWV